ncbi:MAG: hypothetical protein AAF560_24080 [Acidobacteriota bacterium]
MEVTPLECGTNHQRDSVPGKVWRLGIALCVLSCSLRSAEGTDQFETAIGLLVGPRGPAELLKDALCGLAVTLHQQRVDLIDQAILVLAAGSKQQNEEPQQRRGPQSEPEGRAQTLENNAVPSLQGGDFQRCL